MIDALLSKGLIFWSIRGAIILGISILVKLPVNKTLPSDCFDGFVGLFCIESFD